MLGVRSDDVNVGFKQVLSLPTMGDRLDIGAATDPNEREDIRTDFVLEEYVELEEIIFTKT